MDSALPIALRRIHLTRMMSIWRSAGWPCRDAVELDLVAAGWATLAQGAGGHETIRLPDAGIRLLADSRQRNQRALSTHDQLAARVAANLMAAGRIVWRELSLRARITADHPPATETTSMTDEALWLDDETISQERQEAPPLSQQCTATELPEPFLGRLRGSSHGQTMCCCIAKTDQRAAPSAQPEAAPLQTLLPRSVLLHDGEAIGGVAGDAVVHRVA